MNNYIYYIQARITLTSNLRQNAFYIRSKNNDIYVLYAYYIYIYIHGRKACLQPQSTTPSSLANTHTCSSNNNILCSNVVIVLNNLFLSSITSSAFWLRVYLMYIYLLYKHTAILSYIPNTPTAQPGVQSHNQDVSVRLPSHLRLIKIGRRRKAAR